MATIIVNTTLDENDGSITDGDVSLRDAMALADDARHHHLCLRPRQGLRGTSPRGKERGGTCAFLPRRSRYQHIPGDWRSVRTRSSGLCRPKAVSADPRTRRASPCHWPRVTDGTPQGRAYRASNEFQTQAGRTKPLCGSLFKTALLINLR